MGKIAVEVAEAEFDRFCDAMCIDNDPSTLDDDDKQGFAQQRNRVVSAIIAGSLVIDEEGRPVYTPQRVADAEPVTFYEPTGATLMAMDRRKKGEDIAKLYAAMADIARTHPSTFAKMPMPDLRVCMAIATLFLA